MTCPLFGLLGSGRLFTLFDPLPTLWASASVSFAVSGRGLSS